MKRLVIGILAHVDAGKTTTIESMLYTSGLLKKMGRVDHGDAYLDYDEQEKAHGITIYDKETGLTWKDTEISIIDTPGHVDFSSEMERALQIVDCAVVIINAQDGVQSHTDTIFNLLKRYDIPAVVFVNKMDIRHFEANELLKNLQKHTDMECVDFFGTDRDEKCAMADEELLEGYLETGVLTESALKKAIRNRKLCPVVFGSALKNEGTDQLLDVLSNYIEMPEYGESYGARVYRISYDDQSNRLTHVKVTGGFLEAKQKISDSEKIDQIRRYSGKNFELLQKAEPGMVVALKGLNTLTPGMGIGRVPSETGPALHAYMDYELSGTSTNDYPKLVETVRRYAGEDPQLRLRIDSRNQVLHLQLMGEVQKEILLARIKADTGIEAMFSPGSVVYCETIANEVYGVGHYEPLRHYAEVILRLSPAEVGMGIVADTECSTDDLSISYQKSILSAITDITTRGVLTGSELTDVRITLVSGKAHPKHTEGGDFREATRRAIRQGLMKAQSILLEPFASFRIEVPQETLSKALFDLEQRKCEVHMEQSEDAVIIRGKGPLRLLNTYEDELRSFTRGKGRIAFDTSDYEQSPDQKELVEASGYEAIRDLSAPADSVFCKHGAADLVAWNEVENHMHLEMPKEKKDSFTRHETIRIGNDELESILLKAGGNNRKEEKQIAKVEAKKKPDPVRVKIEKEKPQCLIVDGYNMIYDWKDLNELSSENMSIAREVLIDRLFAYQAWTNQRLILVFDGYRREDQISSTFKKGENMLIVYTRRSETADQYIQELAAKLKNTYRMTVATSDRLIQTAIFANGALRLSARELENMVELYEKNGLEHIT